MARACKYITYVFAFVCCPHNNAFGVVKGQLPLLGPVVKLVEVGVEDITIADLPRNSPRNCTLMNSDQR